MKKLLATLLILVACIHVNAQESRQIRISTDRTDLILEVAPDGRLYQSYLGDKLLNEQDLKTMSEAVEVLRQFKGFSYFTEMSDIINRLEDHVASARMKTTPVIDFEKNESLKGLDYLDTIYHAIVNEHPIQLKYRSFKARSANSFIFYPYLLKEYRNRWFVYGVRGNGRILQNLALDRIQSLEVLPQEHYIKNTFFDPNTFFDDLVGVTKNTGSVAEKVGFKVAAAEAPYIITKPIHRSQQVLSLIHI